MDDRFCYRFTKDGDVRDCMACRAEAPLSVSPWRMYPGLDPAMWEESREGVELCELCGGGRWAGHVLFGIGSDADTAGVYMAKLANDLLDRLTDRRANGLSVSPAEPKGDTP